MTQDSHPSGAPWRNFYGRFKGKTLRPAQEIYLREDLKALSLGAVDWDENPTR
ncbi:MAG: tRNA (guanosine(46)-N7)-methyltransferase TrmB, partial [Paracoccaceae bacterium]|nr:tRNA (guanosine(46)-N7)-methyltransferase TrmB [Paracoccaceae bacterium]